MTAFAAIEAEQALLGAILVQNDVLTAVSIEAGDFYDPLHARIYEAARKRIMADEHVSAVLLAPLFADDEGMAAVGGPAYLARLAGSAVSVFNARDYAQSVREAAQRRRIAQAVEDAQEALKAADTPAQAISERLEAEMMALGDAATDRPSNVSLIDAAANAVDAMNAAYQSDGEIVGVPSGLRDLDEMTGGFKAGELVILAGRTSMGKTSVALQCALGAARSGRAVAIASLEMAEDQLAARMLSEMTYDGERVSYEDALKGAMSEAQFRRVVEVARDTENLRIEFLPPYVNTLAGIRAGIRKASVRHGGIGLVVIDYLQKINHAPHGVTRSSAIGEVTGALKQMALRMKCPVLLLSQLNRQVEGRNDKRPLLADLRESGEIEQDADMVLLMFREDYYVEREEPSEDTPEHTEWQAKMDEVRGLLEINVAKRRMGKIGRRRFLFDAAHNAVRDRARRLL